MPLKNLFEGLEETGKTAAEVVQSAPKTKGLFEDMTSETEPKKGIFDGIEVGSEEAQARLDNVRAAVAEDRPLGYDAPRGFWSTTFDYLQRGQFASMGALYTLGKEGTNLQSLGHAISVAKNEFVDPQMRLSYEHIIRDLNPEFAETHPWLTWGMGILFDVAIDPTTYVTFGAGGVAKIGTRTGGRWLTTKGAKFATELIEKYAAKGVTGAVAREKVDKIVYRMSQKIPDLLVDPGFRIGVQNPLSRIAGEKQYDIISPKMIKAASDAVGITGVKNVLSNGLRDMFVYATTTKQSKMIQAAIKGVDGHTPEALTQAVEQYAKGLGKTPEELFGAEFMGSIVRNPGMTTDEIKQFNKLNAAGKTVEAAKNLFNRWKDVPVEFRSAWDMYLSRVNEAETEMGHLIAGWGRKLKDKESPYRIGRAASWIDDRVAQLYNNSDQLAKSRAVDEAVLPAILTPEAKAGWIAGNMSAEDAVVASVRARGVLPDIEAKAGADYHDYARLTAYVDQIKAYVGQVKASEMWLTPNMDELARAVKEDAFKRFGLNEAEIEVYGHMRQILNEVKETEQAAKLLFSSMFEYFSRRYAFLDTEVLEGLAKAGPNEKPFTQFRERLTHALSSSEARVFKTAEEAMQAGLTQEYNAITLMANRVLASKKALAAKAFKDRVEVIKRMYMGKKIKEGVLKDTRAIGSSGWSGAEQMRESATRAGARSTARATTASSMGVDPGARLPAAALPEAQSITSADTSIRQVPGLFKSKEVTETLKKGSRNLDLGGGKFDDATDFLADRGVDSRVLDPFNRTAEHNAAVEAWAKTTPPDTVTVANVLNVIKEPGARAGVIKQAADFVKPDGKVFFSVYEGAGDGIGKATSKGWQNNRKTADYIEEIRKHFRNVTKKGSTIIASGAIKEAEEAGGALIKAGDGPALRVALNDARLAAKGSFVDEAQRAMGGDIPPRAADIPGLLPPAKNPTEIIYEMPKDMWRKRRIAAIERSMRDLEHPWRIRWDNPVLATAWSAFEFMNHTVFKPLATVVKPGFSVFQAVSNTTQMYITSGVRAFKAFDPMIMRDTALLTAHMDNPQALREFIIKSDFGDRYTGEQVIQMLKDFRIAQGTSLGGVSFSNNFMKEFKRAQRYERIAQALSEHSPAEIRDGHVRFVAEAVKYWKFPRLVEDWARTTSFLTGLRLGHSPAEAARITRKALYDYESGLSKFESKYIKAIVPFYSFQRFTLPMLAEVAATKPGRIANTLKGIRGFMSAWNKLQDGEDLNPAERRVIPGWILEQASTFQKFDVDTGEAIFNAFNNFTPLDVFNFMETGEGRENADKVDWGRTAQKTILATVAPWIKVPLELAVNKNFFTGRVIQDASRVKDTLGQKGDIYSALDHVLPENVKEMMGWEIGTDVNGKELVYINPWLSHVMTSQFPVLNQFIRIADARLSPMESAGAVFFNVTTYRIDLAKQFEFMALEDKKKMDEKKKELKYYLRRGLGASFEQELQKTQDWMSTLSEEYQFLSKYKIRGAKDAQATVQPRVE